MHYNMTQEEQIANLKAVKAHRLGYVTRPEVVSPDATLEFLDELATRRGFTSACVTDTGAVGGKLLGLVTSRDAELVADRSTKVVDVMTSASDLLVGSATDDVAALEELLLKSKKGKMPVVNAETGELVGLITRASIKQKKLLPPPGAPSLDKKGRLLCGAAIGTRPADRDRAVALAAEGVDALILDSSQGDSTYQIEMVEFLKKTIPEVDVIAGNVVTQTRRGVCSTRARTRSASAWAPARSARRRKCARSDAGKRPRCTKSRTSRRSTTFRSSRTEGSKTLGTSPRR